MVLEYDLPRSRWQPTGRIAAYLNVDDLRRDKSLDDILDPATPFPVTNVVTSEIDASGLFEKVINLGSAPTASRDELKAQKVTHLFESFLYRLELVVPDHGSLGREAFFVSLSTGAIGAAIWSSIPVDAYGYASLMVRVTDVSSGARTAKTYEGTAKRRLSLGECDEPEIISEITGLALKEAMVSFRTDLGSLATPRGMRE